MKLHPDPYPGDWEPLANEPIEDYLKRTDAMLDAIDKDRMVSFPVADGRAMYYVHSAELLQHIPYGDAWQIPAAHLRGLAINEIARMVDDDKRIRNLFESHQRRRT